MREKKKLVIVVGRGLDDERSSVAWTIANGAINSGLDVAVFLTSSGVDWARKGAAVKARPNPEDPTIGEMMKQVIDNGCAIGACPPCLKVRGYTENDLLEGVEVIGSAFIHERLKAGAAVMNF